MQNAKSRTLALLALFLFMAPAARAESAGPVPDLETGRHFRERSLRLENYFFRGSFVVRGAERIPVRSEKFRELMGVSQPSLDEYEKYLSSKRLSMVMLAAGIVSVFALPRDANLIVFSGLTFAQAAFVMKSYNHLGKAIWEYNLRVIVWRK